jgi:hypothetical protein
MRFAFDDWLLAGLVLLAAIIGGRAWLHDHPHYDPWAALTMAEPPGGWATRAKIAALRSDPKLCRDFLRRNDVSFSVLGPSGEGTCRRLDRQILRDDPPRGLVLRPSEPQTTCAVDAGLARWLRHGVQPAAQALLRSRVVALEHYGTYNCRRIGNGDVGTWSEHATGNAIDIAAFKLADGRRIVVRRDWRKSGKAGSFLHAARDSACGEFATVLSPDYNAAHADHLHLDQARRAGLGWSFCH